MATETDGAESLPLSTSIGFAAGDHTINVGLAATSLVLLYFLTEVAGLRPALASVVVISGRFVDAFTDPLMGRLSDLTPWRAGRRRPYFLLAAIPFGATFALLWQQLPGDGQAARCAAYAAVYCVHTVFSTMLAVPYMALLPELALGYHQRTILNAFRYGGALLGMLLVGVVMRPAIEWLGGGSLGFSRIGWLLGAWMALPWLVVYAVTWERPGFARPTGMTFLGGLRRALALRAYRRLLAFFLSARIAVDMVAAMLIFYVTYWLGRPDDFPLLMATLLLSVALSLPIWLRVARGMDKARIFMLGTGCWIAAQIVLLAIEPSWPRWAMFAVAAGTGIGFGVADLMPWSMLGDVIDADELATGERRDGVYAGFFTFLRKLGGATGVAIAGVVLDVSGFLQGQEQPASALTAIRLLAAAVPTVFLVGAVLLARGYPLTRARHADIFLSLQSRRAEERP
jgi:sugar (glycoside-pentoside-hexuronide) transporter